MPAAGAFSRRLAQAPARGKARAFAGRDARRYPAPDKAFVRLPVPINGETRSGFRLHVFRLDVRRRARRPVFLSLDQRFTVAWLNRPFA
jgi:hypothetical protein